MGQTLLFFLLNNLFHSTYVLFCQEWFLRLPRVLGRHRGVLSYRACVVILICCCVISFCLFCAFVFCRRFLMFCISILICFVSCGSSALPVVLVISLCGVCWTVQGGDQGRLSFWAVGVSRSFIILFSASWWWTFPRLLLFPLFRCLSPRWLVPAGWWGVSSVLLALVCWWWFFPGWLVVSGFWWVVSSWLVFGWWWWIRWLAPGRRCFSSRAVFAWWGVLAPTVVWWWGLMAASTWLFLSLVPSRLIFSFPALVWFAWWWGVFFRWGSCSMSLGLVVVLCCFFAGWWLGLVINPYSALWGGFSLMFLLRFRVHGYVSGSLVMYEYAFFPGAFSLCEEPASVGYFSWWFRSCVGVLTCFHSYIVLFLCF